MKTITLLFTLCLFCNTVYAQKLKIELYNKTGYDLDSVFIGDKFIGPIKKGQMVTVTNCEKIEIQDELPYGLPDGVIKNKKRNTQLLALCGTGVEDVSKGYFQFDITVTENELGYRLFWNYHR